MTKSEFLKDLIPELERLNNVEHVVELLEKGYTDLADNVVYDDKINYLCMDEYLREGEIIDVADIPEEYLEVFIIYFWGSGHREDKVINKESFIDALEKKGPVGKTVGRKLKTHHITEFETLAELMVPESDDKNAMMN